MQCNRIAGTFGIAGQRCHCKASYRRTRSARTSVLKNLDWLLIADVERVVVIQLLEEPTTGIQEGIFLG